LSLKEIGEIFGGISESGICKILSKEWWDGFEFWFRI
jgi:hypothetical protein